MLELGLTLRRKAASLIAFRYSLFAIRPSPFGLSDLSTCFVLSPLSLVLGRKRGTVLRRRNSRSGPKAAPCMSNGPRSVYYELGRPGRATRGQLGKVDAGRAAPQVEDNA